MRHFLIALQFLTILPVRIGWEIKEEDFGKSLLYFPIVGMLVGLVLSVTASLFGFLSHLIAGAVVVVVSAIITGGIHLDGFADTCDGFYGGRPRGKILEIMRDSRIGVMGVVGITSLLLLKFAFIVSIPRNILWQSLIVMTTFARWSQVLACYISDYAREEGKARHFIGYAGRKEFLAGSFLTAVLFLSLMRLEGAIVLIASLLPTLLFIYYVKRKIGGMTGDTIGATSEIAEIAVLLSTVALQKLLCLY
jgi:adenosylcobinamide-GDP ribazoletransferase